MGAATYEPTRLPPPKRTSPLFVIAVVAVSTVGGVGVLGGFYAGFVLRGKDLIVTDDDRASVITAGYLEGHVEGFVIRTDGESLRKSEQFDGSIVLWYEYDHPDTDTDLNLRFEVIVAPELHAARDEYFRRLRQSRALEGGDVEYEVDNLLLSWGDSSEYAVLRKGGQIWGASFVARYEDRVVYLLLRDAPLADHSALANELLPALAEFETYEPLPGMRRKRE